MSHVRKNIRDVVITLLTGLPTTGARVFAGRPDAYALAETELPGLLVSLIDERVIGTAVGGPARRSVREVTLVVAAVVKTTSGYLDTIDAIALEVEPVLANAVALGGGKYAQYTGMGGPQVDGSTDRPIAQALFTWTIPYAVAANAPDFPH